MNAKTKASMTPLHLAARVGSLNCLERLAQEPNSSKMPLDNLGRTPLHLAAIQGDKRCVYFLIKLVCVFLFEKFNSYFLSFTF